MRFMMLYRPEVNKEVAAPPEHLGEMGAFMEENLKAGVLLDHGGLAPSARGARVRLAKGQLTVLDGPFTEAKELIAGYAVIRAESKQAAIAHAESFLKLAGDGENEIRELFDPPGTAAPRFMMFYRPEASREPTALPNPEQRAAMGQYVEGLMNSGVLLHTGGLQPAANGARVRLASGKLTVTDGPFTEAKELVAGYAVVRADSHAEALAQTKRFLKIAGDGECEVRPMFEAAECAA